MLTPAARNPEDPGGERLPPFTETVAANSGDIARTDRDSDVDVEVNVDVDVEAEAEASEASLEGEIEDEDETEAGKEAKAAKGTGDEGFGSGGRFSTRSHDFFYLTVHPGRLGLALALDWDNFVGAEVEDVDPDSSLFGKLERGDRIVTIGGRGRVVEDEEDLMEREGAEGPRLFGVARRKRGSTEEGDEKPSRKRKRTPLAICAVEGCDNWGTGQVDGKRVCRRHGAERRIKPCSVDGCETPAQRATGRCWKHLTQEEKGGFLKKCAADGCQTWAVSGKAVCVRHGAKRAPKACVEEGCRSQAQRYGLCIRHLPQERRERCRAEGCGNLAVRRGVCVRHGAKEHYQYCKIEGCPNIVKRDGVCCRHGAKVSPCQFEGCESLAYASGKKFCRKHGGKSSKRYRKVERACETEGCDNWAIRKVEGKLACQRHGAVRAPRPRAVGQKYERKLCPVEGCQSRCVKYGKCSRHAPEELKEELKRSRSYYCKVEGCTKKAQCKGLCYRHDGGKNAPKCGYEGCTKLPQSWCGGRCRKHFMALQSDGVDGNGNVEEIRRRRNPSEEAKRLRSYYCKVEGCTKKQQYKGLCCRHVSAKDRPSCGYEGCEKYPQPKCAGRCRKHAGLTLESGEGEAPATEGASAAMENEDPLMCTFIDGDDAQPLGCTNLPGKSPPDLGNKVEGANGYASLEESNAPNKSAEQFRGNTQILTSYIEDIDGDDNAKESVAPSGYVQQIVYNSQGQSSTVNLEEYGGNVSGDEGVQGGTESKQIRYPPESIRDADEGTDPPPAKKVRVRRRCAMEGCTSGSVVEGMCRRHAPESRRHYCMVEGCSTLAVTRAEGLCQRHGAAVRKQALCEEAGCTKQAQSCGLAVRLCFRHIRERGLVVERKRIHAKCTVPGCTNNAVQKGVCCRHGAVAIRCKEEGCSNRAVKGGVCMRHGAEQVRCKVAGCGKYAQVGGKCCGHGGVRRCSAEGCSNGIVRGGVCQRHGAKPMECAVEGCTNSVRSKGVCTKHGERCSVEGCKNGARTDGLCKKHFKSRGDLSNVDKRAHTHESYDSSFSNDDGKAPELPPWSALARGEEEFSEGESCGGLNGELAEET
ncbi:hypothetical protein ACHAWF_016779 [Thalassiosira exigua]